MSEEKQSIEWRLRYFEQRKPEHQQSRRTSTTRTPSCHSLCDVKIGNATGSASVLLNYSFGRTLTKEKDDATAKRRRNTTRFFFVGFNVSSENGKS
jgi:hypothetical protein